MILFLLLYMISLVIISFNLSSFNFISKLNFNNFKKLFLCYKLEDECFLRQKKMVKNTFLTCLHILDLISFKTYSFIVFLIYYPIDLVYNFKLI